MGRGRVSVRSIASASKLLGREYVDCSCGGILTSSPPSKDEASMDISLVRAVWTGRRGKSSSTSERDDVDRPAVLLCGMEYGPPRSMLTSSANDPRAWSSGASAVGRTGAACLVERAEKDCDRARPGSERYGCLDDVLRLRLALLLFGVISTG